MNDSGLGTDWLKEIGEWYGIRSKDRQNILERLRRSQQTVKNLTKSNSDLMDEVERLRQEIDDLKSKL